MATTQTTASALTQSRINLRSGFAKNLWRPDAGLVGDGTGGLSSHGLPDAWPACMSGLVQSDPVCGLSDTRPAQLRRYEMGRRLRRRVRPEGRTVSPLGAGWASTSGYGIASRCVDSVGGAGVVRVSVWCLWGCMVVVSAVCGCVGICGAVVVGGLVCGGWIGAEMCGDWNAGLVEINVGAVCGWYINSEEKNFGKGFGKGMAISLLVHKN